MGKRLIIAISIVFTLLVVGCSKNLTDPTLQGCYQSNMLDGHMIQFSFQSDEKSFVTYLDSIEINKGTYESLGDRNFLLKGDVDELSVQLEKDNSFTVDIKPLCEKINDGESILLENVGEVALAIEQESYSNEDIENAKSLLK